MSFSSVTTQPLPFGLEREKHIDMLFRAFHRQTKPATETQDLSAAVWSTGSGTGKTEVDGKGGTRGKQTDSEGNRERWGCLGSLGKLAVLRTVTRLHITTRPELQGPRCVARKTYSITSETKDHLFVAVEESSCVCLQCCGPARSCSLQGFDKDAESVFLFERPLRAEMCCLGCCLMEMRAYTSDRELIGTVHQRWSMFTPYFEVCDSEGVLVVRIQGSCCNTRCFSEQELQVISSIGESIGRIWKRWPGLNEECNMDHEYFGLDVPQTMSLNTKVLLLAATFLLNHMFFEMS